VLKIITQNHETKLLKYENGFVRGGIGINLA
jgi:hypothetical protein